MWGWHSEMLDSNSLLLKDEVINTNVHGLSITIYRGTHEIGGSCIEIESGNTRLIFDVGMPLVNSRGEKFNIEDYKNLEGIELVERGILPKVQGLYKWDKASSRVDGVFISHPHMDHYGLLEFLREDNLYYVGESAKHIIDMTFTFTSKKGKMDNCIFLESGKELIVGDFKVIPYLMDHSAYDSYAFLIEHGDKKIIYSGDFREHGRKTNAFKYFLRTVPQNVDALILEGTMLGRQGEVVKREDMLEEELNSLIKRHKGIILMNFSAQNIDRLVTMYKAARKNRKIFVIDFYTANVLEKLSNSIPHPFHGFKDIRVFYPSRLCEKTVREGNIDLMYKFAKYKITREEIEKDKDNIMIMFRSSMISDFKKINIKEGLFIYSMWGGYLKESSMKPVLKFINDNSMKFEHLHTSGHASIETLEKVLRELRPKLLIPIHSFNPEKFKNIYGNIKLLRDNEKYYINIK